MYQQIHHTLEELQQMNNPLEMLYYKGNIELLESKKVSVVGTRHPNQYTKNFTFQLCNKLAQAHTTVISGGAMGVDAIAHKASKPYTIMISPCGINHRYPKINKKLIEELEKSALVMSQFDPNYEATPYSFVQRNELVVALGECLVVTQCDLKSGSMRSVEFALKMQKPIYVLPHQIGQSEGTNYLLKEGLAQAIYDIDAFVQNYRSEKFVKTAKSGFLTYCQSAPLYEEALKEFKEELFEAELNGEVQIINGRVQLL